MEQDETPKRQWKKTKRAEWTKSVRHNYKKND